MGGCIIFADLKLSLSLSLCPFSRPFSRLTWVRRCPLKLRMMGVVMTTGAISRAKLQSNHHHQQTNIQFFAGQIPFLSLSQQYQSTEVVHRVLFRASCTVSLLFLVHRVLFHASIHNHIRLICLPQAHTGCSTFIFDH